MPFVVKANSDPADRQDGAGGGTPGKQAPGDMAVLVRVLPAGAADLALTHLENGQVHKLATIAAELELMQAALPATVPGTALEAHAVADTSKACASAVAELERSRAAKVKPLNDRVAEINRLYGYVTGPLKDLRAAADALVLAHAQAERARVQREQEEAQRRESEAAERLAMAETRAADATDEATRNEAMAEAQEASMAIAQAQVAVPSQAPRAYRNDVGTLSIRKSYVLDSFDPEAIPVSFYRRPAVLEAVRKELAKMVRAGEYGIPGTVVIEKESTAVRS